MLVEAAVIMFITACMLYIWIFGYWDRRNIFNIKWEFTYKLVYNVIIKGKYNHNLFADIYMKYKNKGVIGFYVFFKPLLLVTDPELVQNIIVKDFSKFGNSAMEVEEETDPLFSVHPFVTKEAEKWKELRGIQVSIQTPVKFKESLPIMFKVAENMIQYILKNKTEPIGIKKMAFLYTVDISCACGFGIEPTAFNDPENNFVKYVSGDKVLSASPFVFTCYNLLSEICNLLRLKMVSDETNIFFKTFVRRIIEHREKTKLVKNDLIDAIMKINKKRLEENKPAFRDIELAGQCLTFFMDSTDTSANQLSFFLLDLANNQQVQEKLRKEIYSVGKKTQEIYLDKIHSLNYLNSALNESLRFHTEAGWLSRTCTKDTVLGDINITKGTKLFVPVACFHNDPEFFPSPDTYDPERFSEENKDLIKKFTFLPFGEGPRMCAGFKHALLQIKIAIIFIILNFKILPSTDNKKEEMVIANTPQLSLGPKTKLRFIPIPQESDEN